MIRYGRCTHMRVADFLFISLSLMSFISGSYSLCSVSFAHFISSPVVFSVSLPLSLSCFLSFSLSVTRTNTEVIISGRLGVKVRYDKHAAVVINFE